MSNRHSNGIGWLVMKVPATVVLATLFIASCGRKPDSILEIKDDAPVNALAFSRDGTIVATGNSKKVVKLWDATNGQLRNQLAGHENQISSVVFLPDGKTLISACGDVYGSPTSVASLGPGEIGGRVRIWDIRTGQMVKAITWFSLFVSSVALSPDGNTLAVESVTTIGGDPFGVVGLLDVNTGKAIHALGELTARVSSVAFSPDGKMIAGGSGLFDVQGQSSREVKVWDSRTATLTRELTGHQGTVTSLSFSPDGAMLATGCVDGTVRLFDVGTGKLVRTLTGQDNSVVAVSFSPDGTILVAGSSDGSIRSWDAQKGDLQWKVKDHTSDVTSLAFSPDSKRLASGSKDMTVKVWQIK
jgi:WD40 repeat protein